MNNEPRFISPDQVSSEEQVFDNSLRPKTLDEFVGQQKTREQLQIFFEAAKRRQEPLDHVLLFGPPGLGKTTLAHIISNEMDVELSQTSGPVLERQGDVAAMLTRLNFGSVLFIDEIHRLNPVVEEVLYPAMEDNKIDIVIGQGPAAKTIQLPVKPFTLVGATTRTGLLTSPLRDRFGIVHRLDYYDVNELAKIVRRSADILSVEADESGVEAIAECSRGTPRVANRLLRRVRDYAEVKGSGTIDREIAQFALEMLEVDTCGLDVLDRKYLQILIENYQGGPAGLETLSAALSEDRGTIEDVIEPFLLQQGFIQRTPRGRKVTQKAWKHLRVDPDKSHEQSALI